MELLAKDGPAGDDERALIAAVAQAPDDDLPRLVFADWLDEHGRDVWAELIRVQCELASVTGEEERASLVARERGLLGDYGPHFRPAAADFDRFEVALHRGFPWKITLQPATVASLDGCLLRTNPTVRAVLFARFTVHAEFTEAVGLGSGQIDWADFSHSRVGDAGCVALTARCPWVGAVRGLVLRGNSVGPAGATALAEASCFEPGEGGQLEYLDLMHNRVADAGAIALVGSSAMTRVRRLDLGYNAIGDSGACAIAASPHLTSLETLVLEGNTLTADAIRAVAVSPRLPALRRLYMYGDSRNSHLQAEIDRALARNHAGYRRVG